MRILVAVASKHGSTQEIADAIAVVLREYGHTVDVRSPDPNLSLRNYDVVLCGSAVYAGMWRPEAVRFLEVRADDLKAMPVWLFESGPIGNPNLVDPDGAGMQLSTLVAAQELAVFEGRLDKALLSMGERAIVTMVRAREGDHRDFDAIEAWAESIGESLAHQGTVSA